MAAQVHPPAVLFVMLFGLALISALLAGYAIGGGKHQSWLHKICLTAVIAVAVYVILDIEYPHLGLIRVVSFMTEQGQHIEKMAIVGDEKWQDDVFAFTAKGFRATVIEFFTPSRLNEARTWLSS
jgi:hypothetical protein